jgi:solute:Na+ symporter, SSS family
VEILDLSIIAIYLLVLLAVGFYFSRQHQDHEDYFLGGRNIKAWHVGLSVVATDVGGGFSIGLGGLGFTLGISGSWMLLTGLLGAWLSAVFLIPKIKGLEETTKFSTFNEVIGFFYGKKTALVATVISLVGYLGFTSSQLLAGAKLTSATFIHVSHHEALWMMGLVTILYTAFGGLKAVIYTDTVQWIILMVGLIFVGIPLAYFYVGGWDSIVAHLPPGHLSLTELTFTQVIEWTFTIIPVWFIGLTLYQRIYACKGVKEAKKAWYIAGLLEWPIMAFMGSVLGLLARVAFNANLLDKYGYPAGSALDAEMALPLLLKASLIPGLLGLMLAAYFSAILSTADSCLMAAAGSSISDLLMRFLPIKDDRKMVRLSQMATLILGLFALVIAQNFTNVLGLMLMSYGVMVSGLFIPVIGGLILPKTTPWQGMLSILMGGGTTLLVQVLDWSDTPIIWGLSASVIGFLLGSLFQRGDDDLVRVKA